MKPEYQKQIDEIMDCFDFNKVHDVMVHLGWKWTGNNEPPTVRELRMAAREYLKKAAEEGESVYFLSCGGFEVKREDGILRLAFVLEDWDGGYVENVA